MGYGAGVPYEASGGGSMWVTAWLWCGAGVVAASEGCTHGRGLANQSPFTPPGPLYCVGGGPGGPDALEGSQPTRLPLPKSPGDLQAPERLSY